MDENIFNYFPINIKNKIYGQVASFEGLEEIRLRCNKPVILKFRDYEEILDHTITYKEMMDILRENL